MCIRDRYQRRVHGNNNAYTITYGCSYVYTKDNTVELKISGINNPYLEEQSTYGASSTFVMDIYVGYVLVSSETYSWPLFSVFIQSSTVASSTFSFGTLTTPKLSIVYQNAEVPILLTLTNSITNAQIQKLALDKVRLIFAGNLTLSSCYLFQNDASFTSTFLSQGCEIETSNKMRIYNVKQGSLSLYFTGSFSGNIVPIQAQFFANNGTAVLLTVNLTNATVSGYTAVTSAPSLEIGHKKMISRYRVYELARLYPSTSTPMKYLQFLVTTPGTLDPSISGNTLTITLPDNLRFVPTSSADYSHIQCFFLQQVTQYKVYGFQQYASSCSYNSGTYTYTISPPLSSLAASITYLVEIRIGYLGSASTQFIVPDMSALRTEIVFNAYSGSSSTQYSDVLKVLTYKNFNSVKIAHSTLTVSKYDIFTVSFTVPDAVAAASTTSPITEMVVAVELNPKDYSVSNSLNTDFGFQTGSQVAFYSTTLGSSYQNLIQFGYSFTDSSSSKTYYFPIRYITVLTSAFTTSGTYSFIIPLIKNPSTTSSLSQTVKIYKVDASTSYPQILYQQTLIASTTNSASITTLTGTGITCGTGTNCVVQSTTLAYYVALKAPSTLR
eukprot:TRINITY_DN1446_c0_g1_i2.p1 TRINITY_DN1446_c0_g1~~TRINITY_DN1446_c0_g1_i2.p1  ORF type:complete len:610 (+),score=48.86 TRINITY_DN1446_c0_g1_i2:196-2025(+)